MLDKKLKNTLAVVLLVLFIVSLTVSAASASKSVSLSLLQQAAKADPGRPQGGTTPGATDSVKIVEAALAEEGLLDEKYAYDGSYGTTTIKAYKKWQESIGSAEIYCDGIPGKKDLTKLGEKYGFSMDLTGSPNPKSEPILHLSDEGLQFIIRHEGVITKMYNDPAGHCTIGIGHLIHLGNCDGSLSEKQYKNGLTKTQTYDLFRQDITKYEEAVKSNVKVPLTQYQYDALVSFTYNIGTGGFKNSSALKELNKENYNIVPSKMLLWNKPAMLIGRRTDESNLFRTGNYGN
jgi:GH24 family phage-related lysozyme (muramidase)